MIRISCPEHSPRLLYVLHFVFEDRLACGYELVEQHEVCDLTYGLAGDVIACGLLNEKGIREITLDKGSWQGIPTLFPNDGSIPFDIFSAIFWCLSRYEEYLPTSRDDFDRFCSKDSQLSFLELLEEPLIDIWLEQLRHWLEEKTQKSIGAPTFERLPTIDVDSAYAFRGKGMWRTIAAFARDKIKFKWSAVLYRTRVLLAGKHDPYDTYAKLDAIHVAHGLDAVYFYLVAPFGKFDKGLPPKSKLLAKRITQTKGSIGIHPSVASHDLESSMLREKTQLSSILGKPVTKSRFHYLKLNLPESYRRLLAIGIDEDYTMGYADAVGFRAATSRSFLWYDLKEEKTSSLRVHPFCVMEATLKNYLGLTPQEGINTVLRLKRKLMKSKGCFCTLWHNESLSGYGEWEGWQDVYAAVWEDLD